MAKVGEFPAVFLSYDEPWADEFWDDLRGKAPTSLRVHGVAGLDACHKAAAEAADTDFFVTVDSDTKVDRTFFDLEIPDELLSPNFRLSWLSRNAVNGLISGNGCLKLWSRRMVQDMRTHEAAPKDRPSLDHDIGAIYSGASLNVTMRGCFSRTYTAMTPYHAFRCGMRESIFLSEIDRSARKTPELGDQVRLSRLIEAWGSFGRHEVNGLWTIYGVRLGRWFGNSFRGWDVSRVNDYDWFSEFWERIILPRFAPGTIRCPRTGVTWDNQRLSAEVSALGRRASDASVDFGDLSASESKLAISIEAPVRSSVSGIDALGWAFLKGRGVEVNVDYARRLFEVGAALGSAKSYNNLARMHDIGQIADATIYEAERLYTLATALGSPHAPFHLACLIRSDPSRAVKEDLRIRDLLGLAAQRGFSTPSKRLRSKSRQKAEMRSLTFGELNWIIADEVAPNLLSEAVQDAKSDFVVVIGQGVLPHGRFSSMSNPILITSGRCFGYPVRNLVTGEIHSCGIILGPRDRISKIVHSMKAEIVVPEFAGDWVPDPTPSKAFHAAFEAAQQTLDQRGQTAAARLASMGADRPNGQWWQLGAGLGLLGLGSADDAWLLECDLIDCPKDLGRRVRQVAQQVRRRHGIGVRPFGARESRIVRDLTPSYPMRSTWEAFVVACKDLGPSGAQMGECYSDAASWIWPDRQLGAC